MEPHHTSGALTGTHRLPKLKPKRKARQIGDDVRRKESLVYLWTLAVIGGLLLLMFLTRRIYPFGDNVLRFTDGDQYFGFLGYLQSTFYSVNDPLYSWSSVLGGDAVGTLAYYCASPFNLLIVLFPGNLMLGYHVILILKFLAAGLAFAYLLLHVVPKADVGTVVLFSSSYPFIGYMTYYIWNQSWMDGVILLPLIALGIWRILHRESPVLYTVSLALALFSNYYIGYMLCIGSVLMFVSAAFLCYSKWDWDILKAVGWFAAASVLAAALAAVLLLPVYSTLPEDRSQTFEELKEDLAYQVKPGNVLSMLFTAPNQNMTFQGNYPIIYTGVVQLVLAAAFFLNPKISNRFKAVAAVVLAVFMLSFMVNLINRIWHGFTVNVWYNERYSFLVSFVLEILACYSLMHIEAGRDKLLAAGAVTGLIAVLALSTDAENVGPGTMTFDIACVCTSLALLSLYAGKLKSGSSRSQLVCFILVAAVTLGNISYNTYRSVEGLGDWDESRNGLGQLQDYTDAMETERRVEELIDGDGLYRRASTRRYGRTDPMLFGYAGVENYSSTESVDALTAADRLGIAQSWSWAMYNGNTPIATDALLGIKNIVTDETFKARYYTQLGLVPNQGLTVFEDPYAIQPVFLAETEFDPGVADFDKIEYINGCWNSISTVGGDVFQRLECTREDVPGYDGTDAYFWFHAESDGPVYAVIPEGNRTTDVPMPSYDQDVYYIGDYAAGEDGQLAVHAGSDYYGLDQIALYTERLDALSEKAAVVQGEPLEITEKSSSNLYIEYVADTDRLMATTIPVNDGWTAYVDGEKTEMIRNMGYFLALPVPAGEHQVRLQFYPPKFWTGVSVSLVALALLIVYIVWGQAIMQWLRQKVRLLRTKKTKNATGGSA